MVTAVRRSPARAKPGGARAWEKFQRSDQSFLLVVLHLAVDCHEDTALRSSPARFQAEEVDRGMEPARIGYHKIVADILRRAPADDAVRIGWQLVSGSKVSQRTTVLGLSDGVLRVRVPDAAWRMQLADFEPQYLAALGSMLGAKVQRIEFVADEKKAPHRA